MARDDDSGDDDAIGRDIGVDLEDTTRTGPVVRRKITATSRNIDTVRSIQQALDAGRCVQVATTNPDGGITIEAYCEEDVARDITDFILRSLARDADGGVRRGLREPINKKLDRTLDRIEERLVRGEQLADVLLNPPPDFGERSQALAAQIRQVLEAAQFLGKTIVVGVFLSLATSPTSDILATQGYDVESVAKALAQIPSIARGRVRDLIELEYPDLSPSEARWWRTLHSRL